MVAVTYRHGLDKPATAKGKTFFAAVASFFGRALHALQESRMRQAEREIALHRHLLPRELQDSGDTLTARSEHQLPFARG
jgi:hypothetical protein